MAQAKRGNAVKVHYVGRFEDGTVFDTSREREPPFTIGEGEVIPGFEEAVVGMNPGESKKVVIPAENAYGPRHEEMVLVVDRQNLPEGSIRRWDSNIKFLNPTANRSSSP